MYGVQVILTKRTILTQAHFHFSLLYTSAYGTRYMHTQVMSTRLHSCMNVNKIMSPHSGGGGGGGGGGGVAIQSCTCT